MYIVRKGINDYLICHCLDISGTLSVGTQCIISDADYHLPVMAVTDDLFQSTRNYEQHMLMLYESLV